MDWVGSDVEFSRDFKMAFKNMKEVLKDNVFKELNVKYGLIEWTDRESQQWNRNYQKKWNWGAEYNNWKTYLIGSLADWR